MNELGAIPSFHCGWLTVAAVVVWSATRSRLVRVLCVVYRSGSVTEAGRQGIALGAVMAMTEHRAVSSVIGYFQTGGAAENPAARLLEP